MDFKELTFKPTNLENVFNQAVTNLKTIIEENKAVVTRNPSAYGD